MPKANEVNTTTRRAFLSTLAVAVPAAVAGAPMAAALADQPAAAKVQMSPKAAIDHFANMLLQAQISEIAEDDQYVLYAVRVPREIALSHADLLLVDRLADDRFGADLAAYMAARIQELTDPAPLT